MNNRLCLIETSSGWDVGEGKGIKRFKGMVMPSRSGRRPEYGRDGEGVDNLGCIMCEKEKHGGGTSATLLFV